MEQQLTEEYFHLYLVVRWLNEYPWEEDNRKTEGERGNTNYLVAKRNEMLSKAIELNGAGQAVSDGALCSWEFRYCLDKGPATKNWVLAALHVPKPQRGSHHMRGGGGGLQTTST